MTKAGGLKAPRVGGAWEWHQDYGYWYDYGCLFPDLVSCMIAVDAATVGNGCLEVVRGSHRMGRLETARRADQTSVASKERIRIILQDLERVPCELEPGDALFFHANTLHGSAINRSERPRFALICVYNGRSNAPRPVPPTRPYDSDAPPVPYTPLERWPRDRITDLALRRLGELDGGNCGYVELTESAHGSPRSGPVRSHRLRGAVGWALGFVKARSGRRP